MCIASSYIATHVFTTYVGILASISLCAKFWWGKTLVNRLFNSFGEENVGKFTIANISYFSESGIWLGKILVNGICLAKFTKISPTKIFALYSMYKIM